jgi:hypothetical protein
MNVSFRLWFVFTSIAEDGESLELDCQKTRNKINRILREGTTV